jgi:integrase
LNPLPLNAVCNQRRWETEFPGQWNHEYIDLPVVDPKKQLRPTLNSKQVSDVITRSTGRYPALYALLPVTGLRIGEALAIKLDPYSEDDTTISSDCKTIHVRKSVWNGREQKPKTENAIRSVDIPETLMAFLKSVAGDRTSGFLFQTDSGLPLGQSNILRDWSRRFLREVEAIRHIVGSPISCIQWLQPKRNL